MTDCSQLFSSLKTFQLFFFILTLFLVLHSLQSKPTYSLDKLICSWKKKNLKKVTQRPKGRKSELFAKTTDLNFHRNGFRFKVGTPLYRFKIDYDHAEVNFYFMFLSVYCRLQKSRSDKFVKRSLQQSVRIFNLSDILVAF